MHKVYPLAAMPKRGMQKPKRRYITPPNARAHDMRMPVESLHVRLQAAKEYEDTLKPIRMTR